MDLMEKVVSLCKRRGFVYPSSEIYGGLANVWDFGPLGTLLKNNIRDLWWKHFVLDRDDMVGIDSSTILRPEVWEASGHVAGFNEAMIDCKECKNRVRADHLIENNFPNRKVEGLPFEKLTEIIEKEKIPCAKCGKCNWTPVRKFNQLVEVKIGVLEEGKDLAYLRGEIAQGLFLNFKNVINSMRVKIPFGIAQQGKAYRNEITMGQFTHRTFEFDLMEFEYFIRPETWKNVFEMWRDEMWKWALSLGIEEKSLRWREHEAFERSHYSKKTMDIEYKYPFGWKEMWGIAYRTDFDLTNHMKNTGVDMRYTDPDTGDKFIPHVIEPTFGLSRLTGITIFNGYFEDNKRTLLKLNPKIAPYKVAVFPLLANKEKLVNKANVIYEILKKDFVVAWDDRGNIGKRYFSQDEIGTPWCVTVDFQTLDDETVTVRDRDTTKQERVSVDKLLSYFQNRI
ncbi:glycine--tRNA ligase [Candidatus Woesebacteria bacterium RIFCSPLOWO2_01_FULL_39_21]|uniref:glycine--tRNA ligase n=1 Tax=Candidatus Woesebacteria bacterium RIFCSPLOWO2_01_FULL_39_21 TaxID=1802519 RepID=A0A1F8BD35_9BACT|nr:MAG: glycine--tRNA ligase [Candidatus Woesebacteria bacterium RIFCSPHIGHO2_01_FULL_39_23]OGM61961.1 MAG: glycine--tRNA ligase [Candidatus Woesebacteria bacterium RIFCSPLOWO2_01_FULL_39_21]